jgi:hypothetical protein
MMIILPGDADNVKTNGVDLNQSIMSLNCPIAKTALQRHYILF